MELLQEGYLRAVAAAAGCTIATITPDDGIDAQLAHEHATHASGDQTADLKIQLKSTSQVAANPASGRSRAGVRAVRDRRQ